MKQISKETMTISLKYISILARFLFQGKKDGPDGNPKVTPPLFPPRLWSVHDQNKESIPRTSNHAEGWHNRFQYLVGRKHVGFNALVQELHKEQKSVDSEIRKIRYGKKSNGKTAKKSVKSRSIESIMENRSDYTRKELFEALGFNM